jgi:hypothetical protein
MVLTAVGIPSRLSGVRSLSEPPRRAWEGLATNGVRVASWRALEAALQPPDRITSVPSSSIAAGLGSTPMMSAAGPQTTPPPGPAFVTTAIQYPAEFASAHRPQSAASSVGCDVSAATSQVAGASDKRLRASSVNALCMSIVMAWWPS